ncbi:glycosyltransferase family 2 protein [Actibacterium ureilyticum]|uniref:glycosyltransferase family 2 protein n=1 Tax=Actibacterium ureilyticum TaxID=1590614 RepID=UPI000BAAB1CC|nr:glycosyltransferase family 2 protein [Actibacterium ureilyticum]
MVEATVLIAAWCAEETLAASVQSALAQTDVSVQVVIADDASTDGTARVAAALAAADSRVVAVSLPRNGGPSAARNAAMDLATGEWLAVLDADDRMAPGRLRHMIDLARVQNADIVCDNLQTVDESGQPTAPHPFLHGPDFETVGACDLTRYLSYNQATPGRPSLGYLKPLIRRDFAQAHGLRYDEGLRNGEDFHLIIAGLVAGAVMWITPEVGYFYTSRSGSVSNRLNPEHARALAVADAAFLQAHETRLTSDQRRLLQRRSDRIADLATAEIAITALKHKQFGGVVSALANRPRAIRRLAGQLAAALRSRLF